MFAQVGISPINFDLNSDLKPVFNKGFKWMAHQKCKSLTSVTRPHVVSKPV